MSTALTVTSAALVNGSSLRTAYITVLAPSTPAQASNTIIYDPTTTPWTNSAVYNVTSIRRVRASSSCSGASGTNANITLNWDASTPVAAISIPCNAQFEFNACKDLCCPSLPNQGGSGVSGKIGLTTTGLVQGDSIMIILELSNG